MALERCTDWPTRLDQFLRSRTSCAFEWGANDCILFAADAVRAITGTDLAADFRDTYATQQAAARVLRRYAGPGAPRTGVASVARDARQARVACLRHDGGRGVDDAVLRAMIRTAVAHDVREVKVGFAQRGDIGFAPVAPHGTLLVRGNGAWFGPGELGLAAAQSVVTHAWAIGRTP